MGEGAAGSGREIAALFWAEAVGVEVLRGLAELKLRAGGRERADLRQRYQGRGFAGMGVNLALHVVLILEIGEALDGVNQLARSPGDCRLRAGQAMRLAIDYRAVELHTGRALDIGYGAARSHGTIEFVGGNHAEIIGSEMLLNNSHLCSARREPGLVFLQSEPMMVV